MQSKNLTIEAAVEVSEAHSAGDDVDGQTLLAEEPWAALGSQRDQGRVC